jgi:hypothetical protein
LGFVARMWNVLPARQRPAYERIANDFIFCVS